MKLKMRLYKRGKTFYVELERNHKVSLKTGDAARAQALYRALKKDDLKAAAKEFLRVAAVLEG